MGRALEAVVAIGLVALAGCSDAETVSALDAGAPPADAGPSDAGPTPANDGGVVRRVEIRSPYGAAPKNLLADGDFEWSVSGRTGSQFAFLSFAATTGAPIATKIETGGRCRSGIRCAYVESGTVLLLRGAAAPDQQPMSASIAFKPVTGDGCTGIQALALACDTLTPPQYSLKTHPTRDADGWCTASATIPGASSAICLYVEHSALIPGAPVANALVDAAMLIPAATDQPLPDAAFAVASETRARLDRVRTTIRDRMPFGHPPPRVHVREP